MPSSRRGRIGPDGASEQPESGEAPPRDIRDDEPEVPEFLKSLQDLNVGELRRVVAFAEARIRDREAGEKAALKARLLREVQDSGFSFDDLFGQPAQPAPPSGKLKGDRPKAERARVPPKYRGPNGEEWSGRGRKPVWFTALIAEGHSEEEYLIR